MKTTKSKVPSIDSWEEKFCYIKLASRMLQKKCYLAFDMDGASSQSMYAHCIERGEEMGLLMRFKLNRVKIEHYHSGCAPTTGCRSSENFKGWDTQCMQSDGDDDDDDNETKTATSGSQRNGDSKSPTISTQRRIQCDGLSAAFTLDQFEAKCKSLMHYGVEVEEDSGPDDCCWEDERDDSGQEDIWEDDGADSGLED